MHVFRGDQIYNYADVVGCSDNVFAFGAHLMFEQLTVIKPLL